MTTAGRIPLFENVRGILIILVVMGHAMEPLLGREPLVKALYSGLYLFHIPAFAFLSGHLSRAETGPRALGAIAWGQLAPLAVFQVLYVAFDAWVLGRGWSAHWLVQPYWLLWFLLSLGCWRLALPLLLRLPRPLMWAVGLSLVAGLLPWVGYLLGLSRTFVFLPCFVAGHLTRREWLLAPQATRGWRVALAAALAVGLGACVAAVAVGALPAPGTQWLYGSSGYAVLGATALTGMAARLSLFIGAMALTWALFTLSPRRESALTRFGGRSLAPFLLHGFIVRAAEHAGAYTFLQGPAGVGLALGAGALLAVLLGQPSVVQATRPLWEPRRLFQRTRDAVPGLGR
ncbi:acyltransferase family protein [Corallococcus macrosporus]|uniref:Acyltransferase family protein n=1 Tax=Myxococcus fulvus (strain ATCC BAA-855 / HW-1) TaxID=483219 RepID=F8C7I4_MYXFH|nr:acyltransferase family protein [Corallococcus macrosporus]AEI64384.1 acyltransferase family protein [Corallococcus macrosporus]